MERVGSGITGLGRGKTETRQDFLKGMGGSQSALNVYQHGSHSHIDIDKSDIKTIAMCWFVFLILLFTLLFTILSYTKSSSISSDMEDMMSKLDALTEQNTALQQAVAALAP